MDRELAGAVILAGIYCRKSKGSWELSGWCCLEGQQQDWWAEGAGLIIFHSWPTPSAAPENQPHHFQPQSLGGGGEAQASWRCMTLLPL